MTVNELRQERQALLRDMKQAQSKDELETVFEMLESNTRALTKQIILDYAQDLKVKRANAELPIDKICITDKIIASYEIIELLEKEI